ncbi:MAG TPA: hypothetical protein VHK47_17220 [Polyangia bacterium]|jgi:hypothetical protein|nr:hypothetical protein [Polyangia bacterium]
MAEPRPSSRRTLVKVTLPLVAAAVLAVVFWQTVTGARRTPYQLSRATQGQWRVALVPSPGPNEAALVLDPPPELPRELFDQVFKRSMESMSAPELPGIPLVLEAELARMGAARPAPEALLELARQAGLGASPPVPRCVGHRRAPEPDVRQQVFFAIFDVPGYAAFRAELAKRGATLDERVSAPVMVAGVVESSSQRWLPLSADPERDCVAPIAIGH